MGFGTYDESEQERQNANQEDEGESVDADGGDSGELSFESSASTDELVGRLSEMRDDDDEDDE
jgi:hypothetical protein